MVIWTRVWFTIRLPPVNSYDSWRLEQNHNIGHHPNWICAKAWERSKSIGILIQEWAKIFWHHEQQQDLWIVIRKKIVVAMLLSCAASSGFAKRNYRTGYCKSSSYPAGPDSKTSYISWFESAHSTSCLARTPEEEIQRLQDELRSGCYSCMYTGVGVCTGLAIYFANLATDETIIAKNRKFLWVCSAGSIVAGAYRFYLGPI